MKEQKYIANLFSDSVDFEGGLLSNLEITPPKNMHEMVMSKIRISGRINRNKLLFRRYLSAAAAVFIFAIGIGTYFNSSIKKESEIKMISEVTDQKAKSNLESITLEEDKTNVKIQPTEKDVKDNVVNTTKQTKSTIKKSVKKPKVDNKTNEVKEEKSEDTLVVATLEHFDSKTNSNNLQTSLNPSTVIYNYEVICSKDDTDILEFLSSNATKISDEIYSLNKDKFEEFKAILSNNNIELIIKNEVSDDVNQINIKIVLN